MEDFQIVTVTCHAGFRGEEYPRSFVLGGVWIEVVRVVRRWRNPEWRCFAVVGDDGAQYLLRHDEYRQLWEGRRDGE
ncbi:MAG: hypothetical protein GX751_08320 [Desulfuromonadaceae bacterium]|nr:hypothetical protein [Desulfuromonadaceae bacterium]